MDNEQLGEAAYAAIANLITKVDPGAMVTRFVGIVEVVDAEGERVVWMLSPPDAKAWDSLGLLEYARLVEYAAGVESS